MTYTPDIPRPTDYPSNSQQQFRDNFNALNTIFANNHFAFNAATNAGKHNFVTMPLRDTDPPGLAATEIAIFCENLSIGNHATPTEIFMKRGGGNRICLSGPEPSNSGSNGYSFLPGKMLIQYGKKTASVGSNTYTYPIPFSASPFSVVITLDTGGTGTYVAYVNNITSENFDVDMYLAGSNKDFRWIAIGPQ